MILFLEIPNMQPDLSLNSIFQYCYIVYMLMFYYGSSSLLWLYRFWCQYQYWPNRRKRWYLFRNSFALGIISRYALIHLKGEDWFQNKYVPLSHQLLLLLYYSQLWLCLAWKENCSNTDGCVRIAILSLSTLLWCLCWASWWEVLWCRLF
jgi:hypothetical protein